MCGTGRDFPSHLLQRDDAGQAESSVARCTTTDNVGQAAAVDDVIACFNNFVSSGQLNCGEMPVNSEQAACIVGTAQVMLTSTVTAPLVTGELQPEVESAW